MCTRALCRTLHRTIAALAFGLLAVGAQASVLYSVGPDAGFVPRTVNIVGAAGANPQFDLGDGSIAYNGGLTYSAAGNRFYAVANDSFGASSLVSFNSSGGGYTTLGVLGSGFLGGLTYNSGDGALYGIATDFLGNSTLYRISTDGSTVSALGAIGMGYYGGLTYNANNGRLYAVSGDAFGVQDQLNAIDISGSPTVTTVTLGDGSVSFSGGIAYDAASDLFFTIGNDMFGASSLDSFTLAAPATTTLVGALGFGFMNAGLTLYTPGAGVPEPATLLLLGAALLPVLRRR